MVGALRNTSQTVIKVEFTLMIEDGTDNFPYDMGPQHSYNWCNKT